MNTTATATITCVYRNETSAMQIIRIDEGPEFYLERMVMPGQCVVMEVPATALLQIHSHRMMSAILEDTVPCQQLQYNAENTVVAMPRQAIAA